MRYKKTAIGVTLFIAIVLVFNQYKRQDVFALVDPKREVSEGVEVYFFNSFTSNNLPCSVLSNQDASNLLSRIKYESFRTNDGILYPKNRLHGITGSLCVIPDWMGFLPNKATPFLRKCVYTLYDPWSQLLYLSEDCSELGWDYIEGFCVSNVPPSMLGVDMGKIERHFNGSFNGKFNYE